MNHKIMRNISGKIAQNFELSRFNLFNSVAETVIAAINLEERIVFYLINGRLVSEC